MKTSTYIYNLENSMNITGAMFDFAVNACGIDGDKFWDMLVCSKIAKQLENMNPVYVSGKSGEELVYDIAAAVGITVHESSNTTDFGGRSAEYWAGWALAQYQQNSKQSYKQIHETVTFNELISMYKTLHEAPVEKLFDILNSKAEALPARLKQQRIKSELSQSQLAERSGVSIKSIRAYEQCQKDITKAKITTLSKLANALGCKIEDII